MTDIPVPSAPVPSTPVPPGTFPNATALSGTVVVTGGSGGLGAAVADAVAARGARPAILDRRKPADPDRWWIEVDLADPVSAGRAVAEASAAGPVTAVVTAAGIDVCGRLDDVPPDDWVRVIEVNLLGTAAVVRAALPDLRRTRGRVVTVASTLGIKAVSDATAYCASKFAVVGFTRALASETAGEVGVTLLIPGGMRTGFFDGRPEQYRPGPDAVLADPAEVADAVVFALSRPAGVQVREMVICASTETSWP